MTTDVSLMVEARTIQALAVEKMREAIVSGIFEPGERLVEASLCRRLGISRPSLREALRTLEGERLVTLVPNRGPHVTVLTWEDALQIYQARALLEGEAARMAANQATESQVDDMARALVGFDTAIAAGDRAGELSATQQFYDAKLQASGNQIIREILKTLLARISLLRAKSMSAPGRPTRSSVEMWAIHKAIVARDPEGARAAAVEHVERACASAERVFLQVPVTKRGTLSDSIAVA